MDQTFEKRKKVIYDFMRDDLYVPMKIKEIAVLLQIPGEQREELRQVLDALVEEGKISLSKRGKYSCGAAQRFSGSFQANARGFGFVTPSDGEEDVFISEENINGAFQGDEVEYIIIKSRGGQRKEGKIVRIVSHTVTRVVGLYEKSKNFGFVRPDNQRYLKDIYIPAGKELGATDGHKVLVELTSYGGEHAKPEGKVVEIIGHVNDPGTDILSIVMDFGIETEFPEKVLNQAVRVGKEVTPADCQGRMDLRSWQMVTIDGEDAKDLDDAVSLTREGDNYSLGVHIADVANYVQERSALDREALEAGNKRISGRPGDSHAPPQAFQRNLLPECRRGPAGPVLYHDSQSITGDVVDHVIAETVIRVDKRMSYTGVAEMLDGDEKELQDNAAVCSHDKDDERVVGYCP